MAKEYLATQTWVMDQIKRFCGGGNLGELAVFNDIILPMEFDVSYLKDDNNITGTSVNKDDVNRKIEVSVNLNSTSYDVSVEFVSKQTFDFDKWIDMGYKYLHFNVDGYPYTYSAPNLSMAAGYGIFIVDGNNPPIQFSAVDKKINIEPLKGKKLKIKIIAGGRRSTSNTTSSTTERAYCSINGWTLTAL